MSRLLLKVQLRLLTTDVGGRRSPILTGYSPNWDLGTSWHGEPSLHSGKVLLEDLSELAPGGQGVALIAPLAEEFWGLIETGAKLTMQEGPRIVGHAAVFDVMRPAYLTRETAAFIIQVHQFCHFVQDAARWPREERLRAAHLRLEQLYQTCCALPADIERLWGLDGSSVAPESGRRVALSEVQRAANVASPREATAGLRSEDLPALYLELYDDVRHGLDLWESTAARGAALLTWRSRLDEHWRARALKTLRALRLAFADD
jgi:hypothetical protein